MARDREEANGVPGAEPANGGRGGYSIDELRALWDTGVASGPSENGPMIMERLRRKILAGTTSTRLPPQR